MLSKCKVSFILTLCCLTVISIGFSSWVISGTEATTTADGNIKVENVVSNKDIIPTTTTIEAFDYTDMGFLTNGYLTSKGIIEVQYVINLDECERYFASDKVLVISPILKYVSASQTTLNNIFTSDNISVEFNLSESTTIVDSNWTNVSSSSISSINNFSSTININNYLNNNDINVSTLYLNVRFNFNIASGTTFKNTIGQVDDCKFVLTTMITSKE